MTYENHDASMTALALGVDGQVTLSAASLFRVAAGVEFDLHRSRNPLKGTSQVPGLYDFSIDAPSVVNEVRPYVSLGLSQALSRRSTVTFDVGARTSAYDDDPRSHVAVGYEIRF